MTSSPASPLPHDQARPIPRDRIRPAKDLCSDCGLCDSRWVAYVRQACAFLHQDFDGMERKAHGRARDLDQEDELYFGVQQRMLTARLQTPIAGAQWTGIVSRLGVRALETGLVDAVLCVQQSPDDRFTPMPVLARTPEEVLAARVNKPTLSNNLSVLEQLPGSGIKRLLAIGVGCQVQALRAVQDTLPLEALYVLGLPCVDNVSREGLQTFLESASATPDTVVHYEFMQDFRIHFRHSDGRVETVPFFGLDTPALKDVFAPSCLSCFDYVNAGADLVVGYMGAEFGRQWLVVRNSRGEDLLKLVEAELDQAPVMSRGDRRQAVQQGIDAYDKALRLPMWLAEVVGWIVQRVGPKGLEYGRFSIDSHFTRNALWLRRHHPEVVERHLPAFARRIVERYRLPAR
ncbi:MAG: Coenzyme F420 hydrogenase/dehydrogenase, beta subunit C-terminal domain [Synechococcus sp.]|uniref:Coenzyme F420 hydrogenase/dehydrogenase, beta subunit C-terminal domain n=1 Tax=unclassified Synechococcus TaxID=2626047 RepID=UPI00015251D9|nr:MULTISPECIES: Coenzyme F420 hydrogenase/dehydrogenase, beta subunit C-terminal domain [unclassified Synechococcus]MCT0250937.1 Coenzyme F420 hydrogenase/dehydrogenase, beta subunit C-terminal domain [Synechococcus sp. CS-197]QNI67911.1 3/8-divinyl-chlorophyll a reductase [Synechococcus sp. BMK-MC-1]CAK23976.1 Coenzyme F420-reducing hydrogenase, beta subunit [Synechococcus sp. WH 7803]